MLQLSQHTKNTQEAKTHFSNKIAYTMGPAELKEEMNNQDIQIIDVRSNDAYLKSHIPNSTSIPYSDLKFRLGGLSKDKINVVYCYNQQCHLAARAALLLAENGYPVIEMEGGFKAWRDDFDYDVAS